MLQRQISLYIYILSPISHVFCALQAQNSCIFVNWWMQCRTHPLPLMDALSSIEVISCHVVQVLHNCCDTKYMQLQIYYYISFYQLTTPMPTLTLFLIWYTTYTWHFTTGYLYLYLCKCLIELIRETASCWSDLIASVIKQDSLKGSF